MTFREWILSNPERLEDMRQTAMDAQRAFDALTMAAVAGSGVEEALEEAREQGWQISARYRVYRGAVTDPQEAKEAWEGVGDLILTGTTFDFWRICSKKG